MLGKKEEWIATAKYRKFPDKFKKLALWIDSSDFPIWKRKGRGRKSEHWSGKIARPARRYMFLSDAQGRVRKVWGGYSPKLYDAHLCEANKDWFREHCNDVGIIGDMHFKSAAAAELKPAILYGPSEDEQWNEEDDCIDAPSITQKHLTLKQKHKDLHSRIERAPGAIKNRFQCLEEAWPEELHQLDCVVRFASGLHNFLLNVRQ